MIIMRNEETKKRRNEETTKRRNEETKKRKIQIKNWTIKQDWRMNNVSIEKVSKMIARRRMKNDKEARKRKKNEDE